MNNREKLPGAFEKRYKSEALKERIADIGMWSPIPGVHPDMNSQSGIQRLKDNDLLFSFIDKYFPDNQFAFEPNMGDGRFVFLPDEVTHQGMGVCVSNDIPGFLEIGHFWYPAEYTDEIISIGWSQVYVPMFSMRPGSELADMIDRIYFDKRNHDCCTFPFNLDLVVKLEGYFMDDLNKSAKIIRDELRNAGPQEQKNGEFLISIMNDLMEA